MKRARCLAALVVMMGVACGDDGMGPSPADIRTMAAVVEGTVEAASRQEWGIRYAFLP